MSRIHRIARATVYRNKRILGIWKLVPNAAAIVRFGWNFRLAILAAFLSGCEVALPYIDQMIAIPRGVFAGLSLVTTMAAAVARIVVQQKLTTPPIPPLPKALEPYADKSDPVLPQG